MKKLLAVVLVALMATPAFAAVQNVKVSGSVSSAYVNRQNFEFDNATQDNRQDFFYSTARLRVDADLSDNVSAQIGIFNELPWGNVSSAGVTTANQSIDLDLANVTLREFLYSPLSLTVGRQKLNYGNGFIISKGGNSSLGAINGVATDLSNTINYDGIKAVLDYKPLTLDLVYAKVNQNNVTGASNTTTGRTLKDDIDLYGINANYQLGDSMNTVAEAYVWGQLSNANSATKNNKTDTLYVPGLRVSTNPVKGLATGVEAAMQFGNKNINGTNVHREGAWAIQANADYALPVAEKYKPTVGARYTYTSGDQNPSDSNDVLSPSMASREKYTAFDALFNDQNIGRIWRSIYSYGNNHVMELSASANPIEDVTTKLSWTGIWLDKPYINKGAGNTTTTLSLPNGSTVSQKVTSNKQLGYELDGDVTYQYTEDVTFSLSLGLFKPGDVFDGANDEVAKQAIAAVGVNF